ncbi:hypothetical protein ZIOFF_012730 [Zingiber officinale]|uniref:Uncharacterized protein n=1 Tax=Zingiber officinale TaxID=94328 RepID=A0A8J5LLQ9_ZINOF|nr:hypothetical protein ZIOFF_012730 [Zingiber officinale]
MVRLGEGVERVWFSGSGGLDSTSEVVRCCFVIVSEMQTQWIAELAHAATNKRPRKRQRLGWDVPLPIPPPQVFQSFYCWKEVMLMANTTAQF